MSTRGVAFAAGLAASYVVIGQIVKFIPNPMVPGAIIALNMVIVVVAGILLGPAAGLLVGLIGSAVNGFFTPAGNLFERAAIIPLAVMGGAAGVAGRMSVLAGSLTILIGHTLNVAVFIATGLLPAAVMTGALFFSGLLFETVVDVVVILFAVPLLQPLLGASRLPLERPT